MKIYVGSDHHGFKHKKGLIEELKKRGLEVIDDGDGKLDPNDDFPRYALKVVQNIIADDGQGSLGILLCGSGQGMCMAANRFNGIRAALGWSEEAARSSRHDDDSNVLCLPADSLNFNDLISIVDVWLNTSFSSAPRFIRRLSQMDNFK